MTHVHRSPAPAWRLDQGFGYRLRRTPLTVPSNPVPVRSWDPNRARRIRVRRALRAADRVVGRTLAALVVAVYVAAAVAPLLYHLGV